MKNKKHIVVLFFCLCACSILGQTNQEKPSSKKAYKILFIGNSLTYINNLPELVKKRAHEEGIKVKTTMVAHPDYAIMDHWNDGEIQKLIANKKFNFVIVQQGPSSQEIGRNMLFEYGNKLNELCKSNDVKLVYFMVWPSLNYYHTFEGVIKNYREASEDNNAILCPVGEVWKEHFDSTNNFDYYGADGFHPSLKGSKVAAEVIFNTLIGY